MVFSFVHYYFFIVILTIFRLQEEEMCIIHGKGKNTVEGETRKSEKNQSGEMQLVQVQYMMKYSYIEIVTHKNICG